MGSSHDEIKAARPVHVKEEMWEVIYRLVNDGKESKTYSRSCARTFPGDRTDPDRTLASLVLRRLSLLYFLFFIKTAKKLVVEPPMTVDLSLTLLLTDFSFSQRDTLTIWTRRLKKKMLQVLSKYARQSTCVSRAPSRKAKTFVEDKRGKVAD